RKRNHSTPLKCAVSPVAMLLAILLAFGISGVIDYMAIVLLSMLLFTAVSWALAQEGVFASGDVFPSAEFLDEVACNLRRMPPEAAFIAASRGHPTQPELLRIVRLLAEGRSLSLSLRAAALEFRNATGILPIVADLISFDVNAAADGISRIAEVQREKQRLRGELGEKAGILSFRCTVLSLVGSASLAIIAFAFPILGAAGIASSATAEVGIPSFSFDPPAFFALLSVALLSSCLSAKLVHGKSTLRRLWIPAAIYLLTYIALILTMGSSL
ncbi:MAG TPA: hypothetical protein PKX17_04090, partial [Candidatus Methanomethylicus sp.]|nr:hypothetical protein [Candidatus Methanomethylicus sp.]